jgi:O-antigen/teichoic acid export membrane protein
LFWPRRGKSRARPTGSKGDSTMGPMGESWRNYERQRRRLNARLGLMVFALLPLPAILIAVGLSPLRMLLVVASLGVSIGILYPLWWRTKHNPLRASVVERRTRRIAWICRPSGFLCGIAAMLSWSVGTEAAEWVALAFAAAAFLLLWFSHFSDRKAEQELRSARPTIQVREGLKE